MIKSEGAFSQPAPYSEARRNSESVALLMDGIFSRPSVREPWAWSVANPLRLLFASRAEVISRAQGFIDDGIAANPIEKARRLIGPFA